MEALADRFGPIEREPAFDALRPRLARAALIPSRVFDDPAGLDDPWRGVARGRVLGRRRGRRLPHRRALARAASPRPGWLSRPRAARSRARRPLRVDGGRGAGGRPRPSVRSRGDPRGALPRGRGVERGCGPGGDRRGLPAGFDPPRARRPARDPGAAPRRRRCDPGTARGAPHAGGPPGSRPPLRGLPPEVRHADPDEARRRGSSGDRVVEPGGPGEPLDAPPARA